MTCYSMFAVRFPSLPWDGGRLRADSEPTNPRIQRD
jgi:hypothetical protein